jgi:signal transduction histidine kinase
MRLSLRNQILVWYALVIALLIVGLAFAVERVTVAELRTAVDDRLQERSEIIARAIISNPGASREDYEDLIEQLTEEQLPYVPTLLRVSDPQRNVLATFGDIPDPMVPIMDSQLLLPGTSEGRFETLDIRGHDALRLYTFPVRNPSTLETIALVQTADSLASVVAAQTRLWQYALAVGVGGSLVAILVGLFIVRRGLRPLNTILKQVREIGEKNPSVTLADEPRPPELQQLAIDLNSMLHRLDTASKARETFIASVSHDIRTPLTALRGQVEVLLMQPSMDVETRQSLERMAKEVGRLTRMTNNLLLNAYLESTRVLVPEEVNLKELLDEAIREMQVLAEGLHLKVSAPEVVLISGDRDLLKQMAINVLDNAIKFTSEGGSVQVTLSQEEDCAVIEVSDTGQGIPAEHLAHITEPFYKPATSRESGNRGVGLGLAIVKQVVGLHGGQLDIHSQESVGTTVTIRLPRAPHLQ